jgi:hypothetical protein
MLALQAIVFDGFNQLHIAKAKLRTCKQRMGLGLGWLAYKANHLVSNMEQGFTGGLAYGAGGTE